MHEERRDTERKSRTTKGSPVGLYKKKKIVGKVGNYGPMWHPHRLRTPILEVAMFDSVMPCMNCASFTDRSKRLI
jgi:hypothetical protein